MKTKIFNLIILDESGSMNCMWNQTISGCNETINTIKASHEKFKDTQEHFVSVFAFQHGCNRLSRYIIKNKPASKVEPITEKDYEPFGTTPLYDALGSTLVDLKQKVDKEELAIGSVTIITDGYENSSKQYSLCQVASMIASLKELGWNFNFIGANIDVQQVSSRLNIDNYLSFKQDEQSVREMFEKERCARMNYCAGFNMSSSLFDDDTEDEYERKKRLVNCSKAASADYFNKSSLSRVAPENISELKPNEIFVFGSNPDGLHKGGASYYAFQHFGAQMGQAVGLQGQSYAIPTTGLGIGDISLQVDEFLRFAMMHPELKFFVTRIGCGHSGYSDEEIAPLFTKAVTMVNVYLPQRFWDILKYQTNVL